jgi:exonuclease SbcC
MIIKSIELENIRSYKKETISFDTGINFLSGDIGSGKSTILLAIEFAFFGFKKGDIEGFELLRKGESKGSIKLVLEDKSKVFEIFRSVKKQKSTDMISQEIGYVKDGDS